MTTATETTLTPEQLAEAERVLAARAKADSDAHIEKLSEYVKAAAEEVAAEARRCPGVESAVVESAGFYVGCCGVKVKFAGLRSEGYLVLKADYWQYAFKPVKLSTKVKPGYKTGSRTFKSVAKAVAASQKFHAGIEAQVAAWRAAEVAKKAEGK